MVLDWRISGELMNTPSLPQVYVFWIQRSIDKEPWPFVSQDRLRAESWPNRCSEIVAVTLPWLTHEPI